jgi:hypothetical protein
MEKVFTQLGLVTVVAVLIGEQRPLLALNA